MVKPMPIRSRLAALFVLSALLVAACGAGTLPTPAPSADGSVGYAGWPPGTSYELIPIPVSSELVVGQNRLLVNLIDTSNQSLADPGRPVEVRLYDLAADAGQPATTAETTYMPTIEGRPGLYRAQISFASAGDWGLEAITTEADGSRRTGRMIFTVRQSGSTPPIGGQAPASDSPTATDAAGIAAISTDDDPDPDFYTTSIADAVAAGRPFVVAFATPAFCSTATCGPALDLVKSVAADYKDSVTFINVEPYQLEEVDGHLQPVLSADNLPIPVPAVNEWGLPTEPYIFVVDGEGKISAKFEGMAAADELRAALDAVTP